MTKQHARFRGFVVILMLACAPLAGCVYAPYPGYYPGGSNFDAAWNAALGGAQDAGVRITSSDPASGLIRGDRGEVQVLITVARQADGSVRVQFDAKPTGRDPGLGDRFSQAYDRRMGR